MPKFKAVKSLKKCCYRRLALSFDKYWMKEMDQSFYELPRLLYILGPFDNLTSEMIQSVFDALVEEKCLKRVHFMALLQLNVTHLDLSSGGMAANNDSVVKIITNRCPKLVSLNLFGLNNISSRGLADLTDQLTDLKSLNLEKTNCSDQVLSVIGSKCLQLMQLLLSHTRVTNCGAYSLCRAACEDTGCKRLTKLSIFGTLINEQGALHCLKNLPRLQYFGFDDVCGIIELDTMERADQRIEEIQQYELRSIITHGIRSSHVTEESVIKACQNCPNAIEARLYYKINDLNVHAVRSLKHLTRLGIGNNDGLTFENGVLPVLREIGHQLLDLTLADVNDLDLLAVGYCCSNLQKLTVLLSEENEVHSQILSGVPMNGRDHLFNKLQSLEMAFPINESSIQKGAFEVLLKNTRSLKQLSMQYVSWITTEIFLEILEANPMKLLQQLKLKFCDNVESEVIQTLVYGCNDLTLMELHKCHNIGRRECETLQKYARKQNMDLQINWS